MVGESITVELLDERPGFVADLERTVAADQRAGAWSFEDIAAESGSFGEFVSQDIIESVGDEYRL